MADLTPESRLLRERRLQIIAEYVGAHRWVTVQELTKTLGTSAATARRDLNQLATRGIVERVHGGGMLRAS
jgi:DeoR/GlpR family transcriptional regulator of sugar metabolism